MSTSECKRTTPSDLLPFGTPVFLTHKGTEFATTWASKPCHSKGRVVGLDGVPTALSSWALACIKTITPTRPSVNGVDECYVKRDGERVYISALKAQPSAPVAAPVAAAVAAAAAGGAGGIRLDVTEMPSSRISELETVLFNKDAEIAALKAELREARQRSLAADAENAAIKAELAAVKERHQAAIKCLIGAT